ncbi:MAG TPA: alpha/beta fold hydrolase [Acidimicrobiales bacterium]|nr:alpha/beta fold hydrolase [Acidimicrobiales bacterium]
MRSVDDQVPVPVAEQGTILPGPRVDGAFWLAWKQVEVRGRRVEYGEAGTGPVVLFLHGWGLDHRAYKRALSRLAAGGVRVLAPAMPGFGGSAALGGEDFTIHGLGAWAVAFLDALGVRGRVLVVGHSFGGGVAIAFAHDHPGRVRGLVLVNSIGASAWTRRGTARRALSDRPLWDWGLHFHEDLWPLGQARRVLPVVIAEAAGNLARDPRSFVKAAGLARYANLLEELEELKRRRLPVVVLWGDRDRIVTREAFEEMCTTLGDPQAVTVEGAHAWLIADPDAFGEVMTNVVGIAQLARAIPPRDRMGPIRRIGRIRTRSSERATADV